jgi:uncharacterized protein (DUF362 family)
MTDVTRRVFLRRFAAGLGAASSAWLLMACAQSPAPTAVTRQEPATLPAATPRQTVAPTAAPAVASGKTAVPTSQPTVAPTTASATSAPATAVPTVAQTPYMVVAHGGDKPEELVNRAIAALGGIERFVKPGNDVIIKPNICVAYHSYEYAATTNPWVVGALVKLCKGAGASRVRVMDFPFGGTAAQAYAISGIQDQVAAAGGQMEQMASRKFTKSDIPDGKDLHNWPIYEDILKADVVINVPIAKHHSLAGLTLGMKNMMGTIQNRESIHSNIGQRLADLTSRVKPALTVVDAVRILMANGPTGGNLDDVKKLDTLIATTDIVAADTYAASLFKVKISELPYIDAGQKMGLGTSDLSSVKIEQISVGG